MADGPFKYLLNYIDHCTKFMISVPLTSKRSSAVAQALVSIFTDLAGNVVIFCVEKKGPNDRHLFVGPTRQRHVGQHVADMHSKLPSRITTLSNPEC